MWDVAFILFLLYYSFYIIPFILFLLYYSFYTIIPFILLFLLYYYSFYTITFSFLFSSGKSNIVNQSFKNLQTCQCCVAKHQEADFVFSLFDVNGDSKLDRDEVSENLLFV